jgi:uncharacterized membrane protein
MVLVRLFLSAVMLTGIAVIADAGKASAQMADGWRLCNYTSYIVEAATGRPEGDTIVVDGWTKLQPGRCEIAVRAPLERKLHYLYARTSSAHRGGVREWGGKTDLCVEPTSSFSMESPPDCAAMGLDTRDFRAIRIANPRRWTNRFTEIENYSLERAQAAGVQRLLEDAGVFSGAIDGRLGSKTRAAIGTFLKDRDLPANTSDADLIDYLEQVARDRAREVGLTLCNRTNNRIWSAIARRGTEGWESRGWWMLEAGGCARAIDDPLRGSEHYVYGEMEVDGKVRTLSAASDAFCVARAKFAINGRDTCEEAAYRTALFAATPPPVNRKLVFEFFERDFAKAGAND